LCSWLLFILTLIITIAPFFSIGFTTADDLAHYMTLNRHGVFQEAWINSKSQGRFYFIVTNPMNALAYIGDNFLLTKIIQHVSLLLSYSLFSVLIKKLFKSKELALVMFLLLIMATPASGNLHLPFIAYPFYFTFSFSVLISSCLLFIKYTETQKYKYVVFSAIVLFIAILFYEAYLVFLLFFCLFIFYRNLSSLKSLKTLLRNKTFYKEVIPIISAAILYVLLYFSFRIIFATEADLYVGSTFARSFNFANYLTLIINLTKTVLPNNIYNLSQDLIINNSLSPSGHINNIWQILRNSTLLSILNTIIQMFLFVFIALRINKNISYKRILLGILIAFLFTISAHSVLGLSEKYNVFEYHRIKGYVTSYYSYFGVWLFLLLLSYLIIKLTHKIKYINYVVIVALGLGIGYVSIITGYTNEHLSRNWEKSQLRFSLLDDFLEDGAFDHVENGSILYCSEIFSSDPLSPNLPEYYFNLQTYIQIKSQRDFYVAKNPNDLKLLIYTNPDAKIYRFIKSETQKNINFMFVIAEINKSTINYDNDVDLFMNATCNKADIHYFSPTKDFMFIFHPKDSEGKIAKVNDYNYIKLDNGYNQIHINNIGKNDKISSFSIESEVEMFSERFSITNMISSYTNKVNIVDDNKVLMNYYNDVDNLVVVDSINDYPLSFTPGIPLESSYSAISLVTNLEISNMQEDKCIRIVIEVRDNKNEIVFWEGKTFCNMSIINFDEMIDLKHLKELNPTNLQFYLWNFDKCEFTINRINNVSVKII
ncbi:MAG: hypothetical protein PHE33_00125, partial [Bacteroidales bacterium]|nr:hypothetical protein [Bacteroidales bacterium]